MARLFELATLALPTELNLRRAPPPRCSVLQSTFWDEYDSDTLIYDATCAENGDVTLYVPKLLNFRPLISAALADLEPQIQSTPKIVFGRHHDLIKFRLATRTDFLPLKLGDTWMKLRLNPLETERFRGLDVVYTLSKNNDLAWVKDWMTWYRNAHGATGAIIADNGSTTYTPIELLDTMASVSGYQAVGVLVADRRFGPGTEQCTNWSLAKFLQASLLNIVRDRFLLSARTMLNVDLDELVVGRGGASVFEAVARSPLGFMTFSGEWRYARKSTPEVRHVDHIFFRKGEKPCPTKYCLRPGSFIGRRTLQVHSVANIDRNLFRSRSRFRYLHLRQLSTSWKYDRNSDEFAELVHDRDTEAVLSRYLRSPLQSEDSET